MPDDEPRRSRRPYAVAAAMVAVRLATDLWWLSRTRYPFAGDFLATASRHAAIWRENGVLAGLRALFSEHYYPPLLLSSWGLVDALTGLERAAVPVVASVFLLAGAWGCVALLRRVSDREWPGLVAAAILLGAPQMVFYSRAALLEVPMAALLPAVLYAGLRSRRLEGIGWSAIFGALCGVGLMVKWTFITAAAGIALALGVDAALGLWHRHREGLSPFRSTAWIGAAAAVAAALVVAGPWYATALRWDEIRAHAPTDPTPGSFLSLLFWYPRQLFNEALGPVGVVAAALSILALGRWGRRREAAYLLCAIATAYLSLERVPHKNVRYAAIFIPYAALAIALAAAWTAEVAGPRLRRVVAVLAVLTAVAPAAQSAVWSVKDIYPNQTGDLETLPADCLDDFGRVFDRVVVWMDETAAAGGPLGTEPTIALHPLTRNTLSLNFDLLFHAMETRRARGGSGKLLGFELPDYERFAGRWSEAGLLIVPDDVFSISGDEMASIMRDVVNTLRPGAPIPDPPADPLFRARIESAYRLRETVPTACAAPVSLYEKSAPADGDDPAS